MPSDVRALRAGQLKAVMEAMPGDERGRISVLDAISFVNAVVDAQPASPEQLARLDLELSQYGFGLDHLLELFFKVRESPSQ